MMYLFVFSVFLFFLVYLVILVQSFIKVRDGEWMLVIEFSFFILSWCLLDQEN